MRHAGAGVLQAPVARHVVAAVPLKLYPALQLYEDMEPVVPVVLDTVPNVGLDNVCVHALAAISLLVRPSRDSKVANNYEN